MIKRPLDLPDSAGIAGSAVDGRLSAPSAARNTTPILQHLRDLAPESGSALEIASGTGEHVAQFASALSGLIWRPSDLDAARLESIAAWTAGLPNVLDPVRLDATAAGWSAETAPADLVFVSNLLHLISDAEARTVVSESCEVLRPDGVLVIYGPFLRGSSFASEGDRRFDAHLRDQDPEIGYKEFVAILDWMTTGGLNATRSIDMPANNLILTARKPG